MRLSRERLLTESALAGFRPEMLEKAIHLLGLLEGFRGHPYLRNRLALKGGTALNMFVFELPRLSVDLDLNYLGAPDTETMLSERPKLEQAIAAVCGRQDFSIQRIPSDHAGGKWQLRYEGALGQGGNLELDLNFMFRVPLWPVVIRDSRPVGSFSARGIPLLDEHELGAGKIAALLARHAARDLFDVHQLLTRGGLDREKLRLAFVAYGAMNRKDWRTVSAEDISFDERELRETLLPVLRTAHTTELSGSTEWARRMVDECRSALSIVLPFTERERKFLDRILEHGDIEPSLLTEDQDIAHRIRHQPGLLWKAQNVRDFTAG